MLKIRTRYGDGTPLELSDHELRDELENGTANASERGNIPTLSKEELLHLFKQLASGDGELFGLGHGVPPQSLLHIR